MHSIVKSSSSPVIDNNVSVDETANPLIFQFGIYGGVPPIGLIIAVIDPPLHINESMIMFISSLGRTLMTIYAVVDIPPASVTVKE